MPTLSLSTLLVFCLSALRFLPSLPSDSRLARLSSIASIMLAMAEVLGETKLEKTLAVSTDRQLVSRARGQCILSSFLKMFSLGP